MNTRISMRDIAKATGFSHSTVSLAMRGHHSIPTETRKRIEEAAKQLGYSIDPELSDLMKRYRSKTGPAYQATLAWLNTWPDPKLLFRNYRNVWECACERAKELGYRLDSFDVKSEGIPPQRLSQILKARNIQGIILPPQPRSKTHYRFNWEPFAVVAIGYSFYPTQFHTVTSELFRAAVIAMRHLRQLGYRRIGFIDHNLALGRTDYNYLGGYLVEQLRLDPADRLEPLIFKAPEPPIMLANRAMVENLKKQVDRWIKENRPDCVLYHFPPVGEWIYELGYKVPEEIGLASLHAHKDDPSLSGIDQNAQRTGSMAVDMLTGLIQRREFGIPSIPSRHLVSCSWVPGKTLRNLLGSAKRA